MKLQPGLIETTQSMENTLYSLWSPFSFPGCDGEFDHAVQLRFIFQKASKLFELQVGGRIF